MVLKATDNAQEKTAKEQDEIDKKAEEARAFAHWRNKQINDLTSEFMQTHNDLFEDWCKEEYSKHRAGLIKAK